MYCTSFSAKHLVLNSPRIRRRAEWVTRLSGIGPTGAPSKGVGQITGSCVHSISAFVVYVQLSSILYHCLKSRTFFPNVTSLVREAGGYAIFV